MLSKIRMELGKAYRRSHHAGDRGQALKDEHALFCLVWISGVCTLGTTGTSLM